MMNGGKFIEKETGEAVTVDGAYGWDPFPMQCIVTYSSGKRVALPEELFNVLFEVVTPQEIFMCAYGAVQDRPTKEQKEVMRLMGIGGEALP